MADNTNEFLKESDGTTDSPSIKWLTTSRGSLIEKVGEGEGEPRVNKLGNTVYEKMYERIGMKINHMWIDDGMYGKQIIIATEVGNQRVNVTINNDSSYARSFYSQIFNLDVTRPFVMQPYSFKGDNGRTITGVSIKQDGEKVSKEFPSGTPEVTFKVKGDKYIVNNIESDERLEYLEAELNELIEKNNLTPPAEWFQKDGEVSDEDMKEVNEAKKKATKKKVSLDIDDDFDFEV